MKVHIRKIDPSKKKDKKTQKYKINKSNSDYEVPKKKRKKIEMYKKS